jgi:hypothetical protein
MALIEIHGHHFYTDEEGCCGRTTGRDFSTREFAAYLVDFIMVIND